MHRLKIVAFAALVVICNALTFTFLAPLSSAQKSDNKQSKEAAQRITVKRTEFDTAALNQLQAKTQGATDVSINSSTGVVNFVRLTNNERYDLSDAAQAANPQDKIASFFQEYGGLFGVKNFETELQAEKEDIDNVSEKHQNYRQFYNGVPVFAAILKTHIDKENRLYAVNGVFIPDINLDTNPTFSQEDAATLAIAKVSKEKLTKDLSAKNIKLYIFREGLVRGVPGKNHLAWEIEVTNDIDIREFVYIDAHTNNFIDQFAGVQDELNRRTFDGQGSTTNPPNYPATPFWVEGQAFPTSNQEANNLLDFSKDAYNFYRFAFNHDSFNGAGAIMDSIFNRGYQCPNASWNGRFISFCQSVVTDDVTAHEWTHAYTQYTHNLIYAWQPGALNEAYSDIFGETIDRLNGRDSIGNSATDSLRTEGSCTTYTPPTPQVIVNSPQTIAGSLAAGGAAFGPTINSVGVTAAVVRAEDMSNNEGPSTLDACTALTNTSFVAGKIAYIDRGNCSFKQKTKNAQDAGAIGVIIGNNSDSIVSMSDDANITIPINILTVLIRRSVADSVHHDMINGRLNVTIKSRFNNDNASTRWLAGEDITASGSTGALRDMYSPSCYADPSKVSDRDFYSCGPNTETGDRGGVHTNSGIPNHAYALIVDGGTYNGQTINGIGLTKAAHIYYRAMTVYQTPTTDFSDHANAIEQSTVDLLGANLPDLRTGQGSGQSITWTDVNEVKKAMLAVEMRTPPTHCNFRPLLDKTPPAELCDSGTLTTLFSDNFEGTNNGWDIGAENFTGTFTLPNWTLTNSLPDSRTGTAFYATTPNIGTCDTSSDQSGVRFLRSPTYRIPTNASYVNQLKFDHWIATEAGFDGGQLMISVNGRAFSVVPGHNIFYSGYNTSLVSTSSGNSNPRASQQAWTGSDDGGLKGSWGTTVVNLYGLANPGDTVQFRWDMSTDGCTGSFGWYIDNVKLTSCNLAPSQRSRTLYDFDGDLRADISVFRPSNVTWYLQQSRNGTIGIQFGNPDDIRVPADYDGDGWTDLAVFRSGVWYIKESSTNAVRSFLFGNSSDIPVPADYDGDGIADVAVYRQSEATWHIYQSRDGLVSQAFGNPEDRPVPADYDSDGKTDIAVYRSLNSTWHIKNSWNNSFTFYIFGNPGDIPIVNNYDYDKKADIAVFRAGVWFVRMSSNWQNLTKTVVFGNPSDIPVSADYSGDNIAEFAVFRDGTWFILNESSGITTTLQFGVGTDKAIPVASLP